MKKTAIIKTEKIDKRLSKEKQQIKIAKTTNKLKASGYTNITHDTVSYTEYKGVKMNNNNTNTPPWFASWFASFEKVNNARWANLETDMTEVKSDITELKTDMTEVKDRLTKVEYRLTKVEDRLIKIESLPTIAKELNQQTL